jgi:hypothetical protein
VYERGILLAFCLLFGCSSGSSGHGGFGNAAISIHIERNYNGVPPLDDPSKESGGRDR